MLWIRYTLLIVLFTKKQMCLSCSMSLFPLLPLPSPVSQSNDIDITGAGEKAESSRYSRSYTSGATLGAELRRGRSRRLSSSLQVLKGSMGALTCSGPWGKNEHQQTCEHNIKGPSRWFKSDLFSLSLHGFNSFWYHIKTCLSCLIDPSEH